MWLRPTFHGICQIKNYFCTIQPKWTNRVFWTICADRRIVVLQPHLRKFALEMHTHTHRQIDFVDITVCQTATAKLLYADILYSWLSFKSFFFSRAFVILFFFLLLFFQWVYCHSVEFEWEKGKETTREIEMIDWIEIGESKKIERIKSIDKETHRNIKIERIRDRQKVKERETEGGKLLKLFHVIHLHFIHI